MAPLLTLPDLVSALERRAAEAERVQAQAPVALVLRDVLTELQSIAAPGANGARPADPDRWLTAAAVAERLQVSVRWVYDHAEQLGVRRLSRRCVRFAEAAVRRHSPRERATS